MREKLNTPEVAAATVGVIGAFLSSVILSWIEGRVGITVPAAVVAVLLLILLLYLLYRRTGPWMTAGVTVAAFVLGFALTLTYRQGYNQGYSHGYQACPTPTPTPTAIFSPTPTPTSAPTPTPTPSPLPPTITARDGATMLLIPAGPFEMGSNDGDMDEQPVHEVTLDDYYIDQHEVTNDQFASFVADTGYMTGVEQSGSSYVLDPSFEDSGQIIEDADWKHPLGPTSNLSGLGNHPVVHVSWDDAMAYCEWRGDRLPTEAEWEKAARGTDGRTFPWGNAFYGNRVNYCDVSCGFDYADETYDDGFAGTAPVGSYSKGASPYGVLDMAGNVWEWVADWYNKEYYAVSPSENPRGPSSGKERVSRGGGWGNGGNYVYATLRNSGAPANANNYYGFRCARSP